MPITMEIRETLDFSGFDFERRVLLQVLALKNKERGGMEALPPALCILSQKQGSNDDNAIIIAYKLNENNMNRFFFEIRNKKIVLLNAFQMLAALDFKPPEEYDCLRSALYVLERRFYRKQLPYKAPAFLPPCLGNGVEIPTLDDEVIHVYLSQTKVFLEILARADVDNSYNVFKSTFYKHVRATSEYALEHNKQLPDFFEHPFIASTGYIVCPSYIEKEFAVYEKQNPDSRFFKLDIGELNWLFFCVLTKQPQKIKETPTSDDLQQFYHDFSDNARWARYLGLQVYHKVLFQLIVASYIPFMVNGTNLIFAIKKGDMGEVFIERAASIAYSRMRNIATSVANEYLRRFEEEVKI